MKKVKRMILIIAAVIAGVLAVGRFLPKEEEDMLIYEGDGTQETVVDIAIQKDERILYIRKIKLIMDGPTVKDLTDSIVSGKEGIDIEVNENGELVRIEGTLNNAGTQWKLLVNNREVEECDLRKVPLENYQGITFRYCSLRDQ